MDAINTILKGILNTCSPNLVILYGQKFTVVEHDLKSADFCIVIENGSKKELMKKLYLNITSSIPFNVLIYTSDEWEALVNDFASYASCINKKGTVIYGKRTQRKV